MGLSIYLFKTGNNIQLSLNYVKVTGFITLNAELAADNIIPNIK